MGIIKQLFIFLRSMIFDKKEEYDITSPFFNLKKFVTMLAFGLLFLYASVMTYAAFKIGYMYHHMKISCAAKNQDKPSSNSQKQQILEKVSSHESPS